MKCEMKVENPEQIEFTLTMTATLAQWRLLGDHLRNVEFGGFPGDMKSAITSMILHVKTKFTPDGEGLT